MSLVFRAASLFALSSFPAALGAADPCPTVSVTWSGGHSSRAVCVGKSGWFVSVVPAEVAIEATGNPSLVLGDKPIEGRLLFTEPEQRLCLIEAGGEAVKSSPLPYAATIPDRAGEPLECISGETACLSLVAGKDWAYRGEQFSLPLIRVRVSEEGTRCPPGTPLLDPEGHLAGILAARACETTAEVFAIPVSRVRKLVEDVKHHRRSGPVWVGLVLHNESSTPEVIDIKPGSPAEEAGLRAGDVILELNGNEIETLEDLVETIHDLPAGERTAGRVLRGLSKEDFVLTPRFAEASSASR